VICRDLVSGLEVVEPTVLVAVVALDLGLVVVGELIALVVALGLALVVAGLIVQVVVVVALVSVAVEPTVLVVVSVLEVARPIVQVEALALEVGPIVLAVALALASVVAEPTAQAVAHPSSQAAPSDHAQVSPSTVHPSHHQAHQHLSSRAHHQ